MRDLLNNLSNFSCTHAHNLALERMVNMICEIVFRTMALFFASFGSFLRGPSLRPSKQAVKTRALGGGVMVSSA